MDLTPYVSALRDDLAAAASVGDEQTARAGTALAGALEPAVRLALMNALSDLAAEISGELPENDVSLRLRGREVDVVVGRAGGPAAPEPEPTGGFFAGPTSSPFTGPGGAFRRPGFDAPGFGRPGAGGDMGDISRMTLRLVDQIKGQAEQAAASQGMSLNSWISQAVQGALRGDSWGHGGRGSWGSHGPGGGGHGDDAPRGEPRDGRPHDDQPRDGGAATGPAAGPGSGDAGPGPSPSDRGPDDEGRSGGSGVSGWVRG